MTPVLTPLQEQHRKVLSRWDMVRERGVGGIDGYEGVLGFDITELALGSLAQKGSFVRYDMACGDLRAGQDVASATNYRAEIIGIDLDTVTATDWQIEPNIVLRRGDATDYPISPNVDLITCAMGLYYMEKLQKASARAIAHWYNSLPIGSRMAAQLHTDMPRFAMLYDRLTNTFRPDTMKWLRREILVVDITKTPEDPGKIVLE